MVTREPGSLKRLAILLSRGAPPSLSDLAQWMNQGEGAREFLSLVRQFLPEHERAILAEDGVMLRIAAFARFFETKYFPLPDSYKDGWTEEYEQLVYQVPIIPLGLDFDDYHNTPDSWKLGYQLMFVLVDDPMADWSDGGGRIALVDECAKSVPLTLLKRLGDGFELNVLETVLKNTKYHGAMVAAQWIHNATDNAFMDLVHEMDYQAPWETDVVEFATREWREADKLQAKMDKMVDWLESDPVKHFRELVTFIEAGIAKLPAPKKNKTLAEVFAAERR